MLVLWGISKCKTTRLESLLIIRTGSSAPIHIPRRNTESEYGTIFARRPTHFSSEGRKATAFQPAKEGAAWIAATIVSRGWLQGSWCMIGAPAKETSKWGCTVNIMWSANWSRTLIVDHYTNSCRRTSCSWLIMLQEYWYLTSMFSKRILTCTQEVLPITSNLGHSNLVPGPLSASDFHRSIYEDYAVICVNFHGGNVCCIVPKSGTEFQAFTDLANTFHHSPHLLYTGRNVIEQQVNFLIHY